MRDWRQQSRPYWARHWRLLSKQTVRTKRRYRRFRHLGGPSCPLRKRRLGALQAPLQDSFRKGVIYRFQGRHPILMQNLEHPTQFQVSPSQMRRSVRVAAQPGTRWTARAHRCISRNSDKGHVLSHDRTEQSVYFPCSCSR